MKNTMLTMMATLAVAVTAQAAGYEQVLTLDQVQGTGGSKINYGTLIEGGTAYNFMNIGGHAKNPDDAGRITVTTGVGTANPVTTELVSSTAWQIASGGSNMTGFYGYGISGDYLQFAETSSDTVWRVHKTTGAISKLASKSDIDTFIGGTGPSILSPQTAHNGNHYFYEGDTDSVLVVNGSGMISTYISDLQLISVAGTDNLNGGITFVGNDLVWGSSFSDAMYLWDDSANSGSELLSTAEITAVTGMSAVSFGDIFYAPDGNVYFYDNTADGILSFDPANASGTLAFVLTEDELVAGPGGSNSVGQFTWYDGNIAWTQLSPVLPGGLYTVPEPMTILLLGFGGLGVMKRYRVR